MRRLVAIGGAALIAGTLGRFGTPGTLAGIVATLGYWLALERV